MDTLSFQTGDWKLSGTLNYLDTGESGSEEAGKLDSRMTSAMLSANLRAQTFRLGYQYNAGDSALPFIHDTDLPRWLTPCRCCVSTARRSDHGRPVTTWILLRWVCRG